MVHGAVGDIKLVAGVISWHLIPCPFVWRGACHWNLWNGYSLRISHQHASVTRHTPVRRSGLSSCAQRNDSAVRFISTEHKAKAKCKSKSWRNTKAGFVYDENNYLLQPGQIKPDTQPYLDSESPYLFTATATVICSNKRQGLKSLL